MHKNNMCVIYDRDSRYAMKLMNIINNDKQVPFGAQVFTEEEQLKSYLESYEPKILMVSEDAANYQINENVSTQVVVLCNQEEQVGQASQQFGEQAIGVYKYQSSNRILQQIIRQGLEGDCGAKHITTKLTGIVGADVCSRNQLSIIAAYILGERESVLYVNLDEFSGLDHIFPAVENTNLSDAFYIYKQNGYRYCDEIRRTIGHMERIDYIAPVQCADDISYMEPVRVVQFIMNIAKELGYARVVLDISSGVRASWHILEQCDEIYTPKSDNPLLVQKQKAMEQYFLEMGMEHIVDQMVAVPVHYEPKLFCGDFWKDIGHMDSTSEIKELMAHGSVVS